MNKLLFIFIKYIPGITSNTTRLQEYISGFQTIAPVTFYYENSPYVDLITKKIKDYYLSRQEGDKIKTGISDVSFSLN